METLTQLLMLFLFQLKALKPELTLIKQPKNTQVRLKSFVNMYISYLTQLHKKEGVLGWYHSHPNYGPWLSGIDVGTQKSMQMMGPMLAIVIYPIRSEISGKVDIGAFRTLRTPSTEEVN